MTRVVRIRSKYRGPFDFVDGLLINGIPVGGGTGGPVAASQVSITPIGTLISTSVQGALAELESRDPGVAVIPVASETQQGKVELATAAETVAGVDNTRAVHPAGLKQLVDQKAAVAHTHTEYAPIAHTHTGYASESHTHSEYSTIAHTHADYSTTDHVHSQYAPLASPSLTGVPSAPTATLGTNTAQIATTAFVQAATIAAGAVPDASTTVAGKVELATSAEVAAGTDNVRAVTPLGLSGVTTTLAPLSHTHAEYAPLASPGLTGTPTAPTAVTGTATTQLATTAFVQAELAQYTPPASYTLATQVEVNAGTDNTKIVTPLTLHTKLKQQLYVNQYSANIPLIAANTPYTFSHNLSLVHKNGFVINAMLLDSAVTLDVDSVDNNTVTLTSLVNLENVYVTIMGASDANQVLIGALDLGAGSGNIDLN